MLRLSVLDQSTVVTGRSPDTSIRESLALAKHCEALGYTRYWCAEHHNSASQAGTAPEDRLPIAENAAGVRSTIRLEAHVPPQQARSPQNRSVCGPQSAIDVTTRAPLHRLVVECRKPQVRRVIPVTPQVSGWVMAKHAAEVFGQACWKLPE